MWEKTPSVPLEAKAESSTISSYLQEKAIHLNPVFLCKTFAIRRFDSFSGGAVWVVPEFQVRVVSSGAPRLRI